MPGLVPGIHVLNDDSKQDVDGRVKPGHDEKRIPSMPHPLDSFFAPESIALIGASRDQEKIPGRLLSMLRKNEFPGKIYPINPNYGDIDGLKCYPAISDVGQPIDLAVVIIPAFAVLAALEQCAAAGVKNAVIISSRVGS